MMVQPVTFANYYDWLLLVPFILFKIFLFIEERHCAQWRSSNTEKWEMRICRKKCVTKCLIYATLCYRDSHQNMSGTLLIIIRFLLTTKAFTSLNDGKRMKNQRKQVLYTIIYIMWMMMCIYEIPQNTKNE